MNFKKEAKFLSSETKKSKKGNDYNIISCMVGTELLSVMSDVEIQSEFGKDFVAEFDLNTKYNSLKIVGAEIVQPVKR